MGFFNKKKLEGSVDFSRLPRHIAIILDGNGRWARKRGMPRKVGHSFGAEAFRKVATYCKDIGIEYLTVYAFSTENWKRPADEVEAIMSLLETYLQETIRDMRKNQVKMAFFGDMSVLPDNLQELIKRTEEISAQFEGVQVNMCINYGGRDEVIRAAKLYAEDYKSGAARDLTEEMMSGYMYFKDVPDPDLIIRPSGELRLSNFLIWQAAYSELYFTDVLWPDFDNRELDKAIISYQGRQRRFGDVQ